MITHVVMWNLNGDRDESANIVMSEFRSMPDEIPQIASLEVGINLPSEYSNRDLVLISRHRSFEEFMEYQAHPYHEKVKSIVTPYLRDRTSVDFSD